jgi:hypothetical protein
MWITTNVNRRQKEERLGLAAARAARPTIDGKQTPVIEGVCITSRPPERKRQPDLLEVVQALKAQKEDDDVPF